MKLFGRILLGLGILIVGFIVYNMQSGFRYSDKQTLAYFKKRNIPVKIRTTPYLDNQLHWVETKRASLKDDAPVVMFVHGAPGSGSDFYGYLADSALLDRAMVVAVDRPGYGHSMYGKAMISIADQAKAIKTIVDQYSGRKIVLVGHSYGGPIAAKMAMDYPNQIQSVIMLAPVNDPDHEKIFWFSYIGIWKATRWMLSGAWRTSGSEKFSHAAELAKMQPGWQTISKPITHLHGMKDDLAPPVNIDFSKKNIPSNMLDLHVMPKAGHLIPFFNKDETRQVILRAIGKP